MSPVSKLHLRSFGYCAILTSLNWFRSTDYSRDFGVTNVTFAPVGLALFISAFVALYLVYRCVLTARNLLERGRKISQGRWIESWSTVLYTLPLLWHQTRGSGWRETDGTWTTVTKGYGHATLSIWILIFTIMGLLLFQIHQRLTADDNDATPPDPGSAKTTSFVSKLKPST